MRQTEQTFTTPAVWEPVYQLDVAAEPFEVELFQCAAVRRLKHLHHFGAGALIGPVTHSRYEHTVGVWALTKRWFPEWRELHAAAILHDVGHLPFSHSVEKALGKSHHALTEEVIRSASVASILAKHGLCASRLIELLNEDTPLSGQSDGIRIDHLDSFLRDTYGAGLYIKHPSDIIRGITFCGNRIAADEETALHICRAVAADNRIFAHPFYLAADEILSRAVLEQLKADGSTAASLDGLTDYQLLQLLESSSSAIVRDLTGVLTFEPHRIVIRPYGGGAYNAELRKIYNKQPLAGDRPVSDKLPEAKRLMSELEQLPRSCSFDILSAGR
ncbi:HD domain-containing protein [Paenibacillus oceani]|uniref:HD domain-containing protein n=1 Tax=Paenibacillus oceani TaxID=2772510 RepID=A0A927CJ35_9BACL|nr:HD domain-containing protein [Paenibacillus oceani]MBD2866620.1 HD domain-containing protein [Paenibacillus oceani]